MTYGWRPMGDGTDHMASLMVGVRLPIWAGSRQLAMRQETRAMREMAATIEIVSAERVRDELVKLLMAPHPRGGLELLCASGLARPA